MIKSSDCVVVLVTTKDAAQARTIARGLLEARLAACVNIVPKIESHYIWQGKEETSAEALCVIKTRQALFSKLAARVKALHSYSTPEIVQIPITAGDKGYLDWIRKETRSMRTILLLSVIIGGLLASPVLAMGTAPRETAAASGQKAPDMKLPTTDGAVKSIADLREGHKAIVFFWATWCPHCNEALDDMKPRLAEFEKAGIRIIPVDVGEEAALVARHLKEKGIALVSLVDGDNALAEQYNIVGVPTLIFLDEAGTIKDVQHYLPDDYSSSFTK